MVSTNSPCLVWACVLLWVISLLSIIWALSVLFWMGDILLITQADVVIALLLLSGLIMLPTNCYMIYSIAHGDTINYKSKVFCCPMWMLKVWIIIINLIGVAVCIQKLCVCSCNTKIFIEMSMKNYRNMPRYKHFMDTLQWTMKCCGLNSYKDWFHQNWNERLHDYEWDSTKQRQTKDPSVADSVPLSCCKSGTCVPNYLTELGTHSIHTNGCHTVTYNAYVLSMTMHLTIFLAVAFLEIFILDSIIKNRNLCEAPQAEDVNVCHIMPINNRFEMNSSSSACHLEDSDYEPSKSPSMRN